MIAHRVSTRISTAPMWAGWLAFPVIAVGFSTPALAQHLHVFGPAGNGSERRVLAVIEDRDQRCVGTTTPVEWTATDGVVETLSPAGSCVFWLAIRSRAGQRVQLEAHAPTMELRARTVVSLSDHELLEVELSRRGSRLAAQVSDVDALEDLTGTVFTPQGQMDLERRPNGTLEARVPPGTPVGVLVRSSSMVGVAALPGARRRGAPRALLMPAAVAIEAAGPAREAAFVVAYDRRGRLSTTMPLSIQSESGVLRSMRWVARGVAAVGLSAPANTDSIDLSVGFDGRVFARVDLPVAAGWPVIASIRLPHEIRPGEPLRVAGSATSLAGSAIPLHRLRARCGSGSFHELPLECSAQPHAEQLEVVLGVVVDGRVVPLDRGTVAVREERPPTSASGSILIGGTVFAQGAIDVWGRPGVAAGVRAWVSVLRWLRLGVSCGSLSSHVFADATNTIVGALRGWRHTLEIALLAELRLGFPVGVLLRAQAGGGWTRADSVLDSVSFSGDAISLHAALNVGPRIAIDEAELGVSAGARFGGDVGNHAWDGSPVTFTVEASASVLLD